MTFRKRRASAAALGVATLIGAGVSAPPAQAAYVVTLKQDGLERFPLRRIHLGILRE